MLTDEGQAQKTRCFAPCEHWRVCMAEAKRRGSDWADFCAYGGDDPAGWLNLTAELWDGPRSGCPAGYWDDVDPIDVAAQAAALRDTAEQDYARTAWKPWAQWVVRQVKARLDLLQASPSISQAVKDTIAQQLTQLRHEALVQAAALGFHSAVVVELAQEEGIELE
jgi:hypothetical protein